MIPARFSAALVAGSIACVYACAFFFISVFDNGMFSDYGYPIHNGGDSSHYAFLSENLLERGVFSIAHSAPFIPDMLRSPGYPFFLEPLYAIDHSFYFAIFVQVLLVIGSAFLIRAIGSKFLPNPWPTVCALLFAFDPAVIFYSLSIWSDTLFAFLLLLVVYALFVREQNTLLASAAGGALLGFATLVRPAGGYLIFIFCAFALYYFLRRFGWKKALASVFLFLSFYGAVLLPWCIRNYTESGGTLGISSIGAYTILFYDVQEFLAQKRGESTTAISEELRSQLPTQNEAELRNLKYSKDILNLAKKYILASPIEYAVFHLKGSVNLFLGSSIRDTANNLPVLHAALSNLHLMSDNTVNVKELAGKNPLAAISYSVLSEPLLTVERLFWLLSCLLALMGAVYGFLRWPEKRFFLAICGVIVLYTMLVIGPVSYPRYRISAEPFFFLSAAAGISVIFELKSRKSVANAKLLQS